MGDAHFIENQLPYLREYSSPTAETLIFQHDGAPAHYSRRAREILDTRFPDRWIGRGSADRSTGTITRFERAQLLCLGLYQSFCRAQT